MIKFSEVTKEFYSSNWITNKSYMVKKGSPVPTLFKKDLSLNKPIKNAEIYCTALGIYRLKIDDKWLCSDLFYPGFTSYKNQIQVQHYDVTNLLKQNSQIKAVVGGGWAVGDFNYNRKNKIISKRTALRLLLKITYFDGTTENIVTDESWQVSQDGNLRFACFYDGEIYDATIDENKIDFVNAKFCTSCKKAKYLNHYGLPVVVWNTLTPTLVEERQNGNLVYDFGQNFAGMVKFKVDGKMGQKITFKHAECLNLDGSLNTEILRTAKQELVYICKEGEQEYCPSFTYMGFRYVEVSGVKKEKLTLKAVAISSKLEEVGTFSCSNEKLNKLNQNTRWSARSNFVDIPTDCPQRDERLGWTGDIAIFSQTACFNYDMSTFFNKWMLDVKKEQSIFGGIPLVVPKNGNECPPFTTAVWGDCCILVPWAEYMARGDIEMLKEYYPVMRKFIHSVKRWAGAFSFGHHRYIWKLLFQFGDWCAPDGWVMDWMKKGKWIATAYLANSCQILAQVASLLGYKKDAEKYKKWRKNIEIAYRKVFTDGKGNLKKPFQSGYVLPLYFDMVEGEEKVQMAKNLAELVKNNGNKLSTGFPTTPFILFALADNGQEQTAFDLLLQEECPSWLYAINNGATTIWERWNAVLPDGNSHPNGMGSLNHYAYGSVCSFLYRRVLGIEPILGGYKSFKIKPIIGDLKWAKGSYKTPYGTISVEWSNQEKFSIKVKVPFNTTCQLVLPDGRELSLTAGEYTY